MAPVLVIVALAACVAHRPMSTLWFGLATVSVGAAVLWYGRDPQKAVLPGIAAGLVPLVFALCANHMHAWAPTVAVPAYAALGGAVAGLAVASVGNQRMWLVIAVAALLAFAYLKGAAGKEASAPASTSSQETHQ